MNKIVSKSYYKVLFNSVIIIFILPDELEIVSVYCNWSFRNCTGRKKECLSDGWTGNVLWNNHHIAYLRVHSLANSLYFSLSVLYILAISGTSGSSGFGSHSSEQMDNKTGTIYLKLTVIIIINNEIVIYYLLK